VTLSVLELVQLADMCRFIVVCWVKGMNWVENITAIKGTLISRYGRLPLVLQGLSVVMNFQFVTEWSRISVEGRIN
jgi:hypothetical protein